MPTGGSGPSRTLERVTTFFWVGAIIMAVVVLFLGFSLDQSYSNASPQTSGLQFNQNAPYMNPDLFEGYAIPDSMMLCKPTEGGTKIDCLQIPHGSFLLVPKEARGARRDST